MQKDEEGSDHAWSISGMNMVTSDLDNIVHTPIVFPPNVIENNQMQDSSLRTTLLIGLDKNFFESSDDAGDVIFVENPELNGTDKGFLPSGNYVISFVDTSKDSPWEANLLTDIKFKQETTKDPSWSVNLLSDIQCKNDNPSQPSVSFVSASNALRPEPSLACSSTVANSFEDNEKPLEQMNTALPSFQNECVIPLPEGRLPLKKKAKMKGPDATRPCRSKTGIENPVPSTSKTAIENEKKWKRRQRGKRKCCYSDSDSSDNEEAVCDFPRPDPAQHRSLNDVVNHLKEVSLIDDEFADLINAGLLEMTVDIFGELVATHKSEPSHQLLAFAFLMYFKRRPAYTYLGRIFGDKWPTKMMLKKWKELVNSASKPKRRKRKV